MASVLVNGVNLNYQVSGQGHTLVLIHGTSYELSTWNPQVAYFSNKYRVITYDIRGHGQSEVSKESYSIGDCVEDLYQLLLHLDVERTYLGGLSMGGNIALSFTLTHPELVDAVILAGANPGAVIEEFRRKAGGSLPIIQSKGIEFVLPMYREMFYSEDFIRNHPDYIAGWEKRFLSNSIEGFMKALEANFKRPELTPRLSEIHAPALIILGDQDVVTPRDVSDMLNKGIANSKLAVIPNCGHLCNEEQPDTFNSIVGDFLESVQ